MGSRRTREEALEGRDNGGGDVGLGGALHHHLGARARPDVHLLHATAAAVPLELLGQAARLGVGLLPGDGEARDVQLTVCAQDPVRASGVRLRTAGLG